MKCCAPVCRTETSTLECRCRGLPQPNTKISEPGFGRFFCNMNAVFLPSTSIMTNYRQGDWLLECFVPSKSWIDMNSHQSSWGPFQLELNSSIHHLAFKFNINEALITHHCTLYQHSCGLLGKKWWAFPFFAVRRCYSLGRCHQSHHESRLRLRQNDLQRPSRWIVLGVSGPFNNSLVLWSSL